MNFTRRRFLHAGGVTALAATTACDSIPEALLIGRRVPARGEGPFQVPAGESTDLVSHALNRLTFGPRPGDYERVRKLGADEDAAFAAFLDEQLNPSAINDPAAENALRRFETLGEPPGELFEYQEKLLLAELTRGTLLRAVLSERQLYEVMVHFWSDHFNIDPSKGDCKWLKTADDRDVIRAHALGRFPEMLRASALSPAMLWYLDGRVNRRAKSADKPNENYGRELLELHTLGVHGGYSQKDVMEVARCLTGWTVRGTNQSKHSLGKVEFNPDQHDKDAKEVLGKIIPAIPVGVKREEAEILGRNELDQVLEIVGLHPATAKHLATKLCRRFIADEPPAAAVTKVADAFLRTRGDIGSTLRALFATTEFRTTRANKFKRPFHFIVSALRATDTATDAPPALMDFLVRMGHAPFHYPTPDGYPEEATPWMGTLLWRWNFAVALTDGKINGVKFENAALRKCFRGDDELFAHFLGRKPTAAETDGGQASGALVPLLLASPGFQKC
ncbi:hypothetical protein LBMAG56_00130 [Verrucomicrobiota bacterium]|nr:hypothetical protein LBMAG56_00130 [Verrucomicrobiota bacterium]